MVYIYLLMTYEFAVTSIVSVTRDGGVGGEVTHPQTKCKFLSSHLHPAKQHQ